MILAKSMRPEDLGIGKLFERIRDAVIVADAKTQQIILWNPAATRIFGYSASEALKLRVEALVPEHLKAQHRAGKDRYAETGGGFYIDSHGLLELPAVRKGGEEIHVEFSLNSIGLVDDVDGDGRFVLAIIRDVTGRKRAEEALKESEEQFRSAFEDAPIGVSLVGLDGRRLRVNHALCEMLLCSEEELLGRHYLEDVHPDDREISTNNFRRALEEEAGSYILERRYICADGSVKWNLTSVSLIRDSKGYPKHFVCLHQDITERKQAEEELRKAEELWHSTFDDAAIGMAVNDLDGRFTRVNRSLCEMLGYSEEELLNKTFRDITHPDDLDASVEHVRRALEGETDRYRLEKRYLHADGHPIWVLLNVSLVRDRKNHPLYLIAQMQDIAERKQAEEELKEANRRLEEFAALRADFTAMVAHEIGSPLATIRGFLDMLTTGELEPADQTAVLAKIQVETDRLSTLVADVRSAAAIEREDFALVPRRTAVDELLEDATRFAETLPGDHLLIVEAATEEQVWADRYRIGQVLRNLLSNAAKYSPDGAPIELRAVRGEDPGRVRIEVADHGCGVHPDDAEWIFEKFGRGRGQHGRKTYGVGLGLYLSRRIVRAHGSELTLNSTPGTGSVFGFELESV